MDRMRAGRALAACFAFFVATGFAAPPAAIDGPAAPPSLAGFRLPVDVPLDLAPALLPGAPRDYRGGTHEGLDFPAPYGAPVRAARDGVVVRADGDYVEWSDRQRAQALALAVKAHETPADVLDRLRGRQVWIDHGDGVVTRYAHLSAVADVRAGDAVRAGDVVGRVGISGFPEGGPHLHFEIRVGDAYLGEGLAPDDVAYAFARAFSPAVVWSDR